MYKKIVKVVILVGMLISMSVTAYAKGALRVSCADGSENASIYANGEYKGECPKDLFLEPGDITLKAVLKVDSEHERVYSTNIRMFDGRVKRLEVSLSSPQLTASAIKNRRIQRERADKRKAETALNRANRGDIESMREISGYYAQGLGVKRDSTQASYWDNKATAAKEQSIAASTLRSAQSGNTDAMSKMAGFYDRGQGVQRDSAKAQKWREKKAEVFLRKANSGDVSAMKKIGDCYKYGIGVERNHTEAQNWYRKIESIKQDKIIKAKKEERNKEIRAELSTIEYFPETKAMIEESKRGVRENPLFIITSPIPIGLSLFTDLAFAPSETIRKKNLESELNARAAQWNKPNSMMAKAYTHKYEMKNSEVKTVISSR